MRNRKREESPCGSRARECRGSGIAYGLERDRRASERAGVRGERGDSDALLRRCERLVLDMFDFVFVWETDDGGDDVGVWRASRAEVNSCAVWRTGSSSEPHEMMPLDWAS